MITSSFQLTADTFKAVKISYFLDHHHHDHPVRYQPNDSFRTLQPDRSRRVQNDYIEVHNPYHTIQKKPKRTNQEDFLY